MRGSLVFPLILLSSCAPSPPPPPMTTLSLEIAVEGPLEVGKPVRLTARITNVGAHDGAGVLNLDLSASNRYPRYHIYWTDPDNGLNFPLLICGTATRMQSSDVVDLKPGDSFDPFGPTAYRHPKVEVIPRVAGRHRVELYVDYSEADPRKWNSPWQPVDEPVAERLARVPRVKLSASAEFDVK